jgi:hypothetical protein
MILRALGAGKNHRNIFGKDERAQNLSKILPQLFHNSSTPPGGRGIAKSVYNYSTIIFCRQFTLVRKQRFYKDFGEEL